ncbi:MAG TPA: acyl carrier protein [Chitinophaga sp.]|uniref:acyl carrier protein n=1 Tax=Chitinophaga sp. TaxID=1869181 RepID=UPI002CB7FDBE|nr:acyl carrier protein [Chitinophaga sp.]HVI45630.1 acyl carrier protein [Chitinophaga sp.]
METTTQTSAKTIIREFLQKRIGSEIRFADEEDIFKLGLVNSLFALELVVFLENSFSIAVENEDLNLQNFNTVDNLEAFIQKKKGN